mmetsp:Transcript_4951/g.12057  ORF Transcript_4951/g.12057 Transcript_4951/m.12057 type:complete len:248 (-) Transcript_4951:669-1412(-)
MSFAAAGSSRPSSMSTTVPRSSSPRRPARPLIWMYSPLDMFRKLYPSNLRTELKMTVRAGMLRPVEKVSVANSTLTSPSWKSSSMTSFTSGRSPLWCTPIPRLSMGRISLTCGSFLSSTPRQSVALRKTCRTSSFSSSVFTSMLTIWLLSSSTSDLLKLNTMTGSRFRWTIILTTLKMSELSPVPVSFFAEPFFFASREFCLFSTTSATTFWKLSSLNTPLSSTTRYRFSPPLGCTKCCKGVGRNSV